MLNIISHHPRHICCLSDVKLVGGDSPWEGRVEVLHNGVWGTVCDDSWDVNDAKVVCRSLGYGGAATYVCCSAFGQGSGSILLDNVACNGNEASIFECSHEGWGTHNCNHYEDAGVRCQGKKKNVLYNSCLCIFNPFGVKIH